MSCDDQLATEVAICRVKIYNSSADEFVCRFTISSNSTWQIMMFYVHESGIYELLLQCVVERFRFLESTTRDNKNQIAWNLYERWKLPWLRDLHVDSVIRFTAKLWIWSTVWPSNRLFIELQAFYWDFFVDFEGLWINFIVYCADWWLGSMGLVTEMLWTCFCRIPFGI